jgi:hypothetical protein
MANRFSYTEYKNIINLVRYSLPIVDYKEAKNKDKFCVVRHDIEYSIDRALKLARIETNELGISTTYCVQLKNNIYNAISHKNIKKIREIKSLGHYIALHQNLYNRTEDVEQYTLKDIETLENYYEFKIDRFSYHKPKSEHLKEYIKIPGKINCNAYEFFHYFEGREPKKLRVNYLADSNHQWKWGDPIYLDYSKVDKLQLNMHPYSWSEKGLDNIRNTSEVIKERNKELVKSMSEIKTFPKEFL